MEYINFKSKLIEKKAKSELKKISEDYFVQVGRSKYISYEGVKQISKLRIHSSDFTNDDLKDLKYFTGLKQLEVFSFDLTDLQNIPLLESLESICLRLGDVSIDLRPLEYFRSLKKIDIEGCGIENLEPLSNLSKLNSVRLGYNNICDLSGLQNLKSMKELYLHCNKIEDISPLDNLEKISDLRLESNRITDLNPLKKLKRLKTLNLYNNEINKAIIYNSTQRLQNR